MEMHASIIIHVGPALTGNIDSASTRIDIREQLSIRLEPFDRMLVASPVTRLCLPEVFSQELQALKHVARALHACQQVGRVLSVATLSRNMFDGLLTTLFDLGLASRVCVVLHRHVGQAPSVHKMSPGDGTLNDWPFDILDANLSDNELAAIGFEQAYA